MKLNTFVGYLEKIDKTASRNEIIKILAALINRAGADEIGKICHLSLGRLTPGYRRTDFNLAEKTILKVIARAFGQSDQSIKIKFQQTGDLGRLAEKLAEKKKSFKKQDYSFAAVYQTLMAIALESGQGSQERKIAALARLLENVSPLSARYLVRIPLGKLRLGFSEATFLDALSWSKRKDKSLRPQLQHAFNVSADIGRVAEIFRQKGIGGIKKIKVKPGIPIMPALTEREETIAKIIKRMGKEGLVEPKYDGFRIQIHIGANQFKKRSPQKSLLPAASRPRVKLFSRSLEDITAMMPEIARRAAKIKVKSAIFDGEAVGFSPASGRLLPFQETTQRKRKYGIKQASRKIPLKIFVFDLLYLQGRSLIGRPLAERRRLLETLIGPKDKTIATAPQNKAGNAEQAKKIFQKYVGEGLEGVVFKKRNSPYHAGQRHFDWIKFKKSAQTGLADTVDCLVMGYYFGRGKRHKFGLGAFLAGIYRPGRQKFYTIAKIGTGLTDKQWRRLFSQSQKLKTKQKPKEYLVPKELFPHAWLSPGLVVEIAADEISRSPLHSSGFALRFPRLSKFRPKKPTQINTIKEIKKLYNFQKNP